MWSPREQHAVAAYGSAAAAPWLTSPPPATSGSHDVAAAASAEAVPGATRAPVSVAVPPQDAADFFGIAALAARVLARLELRRRG